MWHSFTFKKRGFIFLSLLFSFLISRVLVSSVFQNETPLYSFSKVEGSITNFSSKLEKTVGTFLAGITAKKIITNNEVSNPSDNTDFEAVPPETDTVLPTESSLLKLTNVQPSVKPTKVPVVKRGKPTPTNIPLTRPSPTNIPRPTIKSPRPPSPTTPPPVRPTSTPIPRTITYPDPIGLPPPSSKIHDLAVEIGEKVGVPPALILTFMHIETGDRFYSGNSAFIEQYSKPGATLSFTYDRAIPDSCLLNRCAAAGPMQMTIGYDSYNDHTCSRCDYNINNNTLGCGNAWNRVVSQVKSLIGSSTVSPCNIRENIYGAAINIKNISTWYQGEGIDCTWPHPDIYKMQPVVNGMKWNIKAVYLAGCHYYNDCVTKNSSSGNKNYCQYLWDSLPPEHKLL